MSDGNVTVLSPDDRGEIKCRECGRRFPHEQKHRGGIRYGYDLLRAHFNRAHPFAAHDLDLALAKFDRDNSLIIAEGRQLCAPAKGNRNGD